MLGVPQRQRERQQPAHAIAENGKRHARQPRRRGERSIEPQSDIVRQVEAAFLRPGHAPIDDERPQPARGQVIEKAALGQQVENMIAVDQRRHDDDAGRRRVRAVIEQSGRSGPPHHPPPAHGAAIRVAAIRTATIRTARPLRLRHVQRGRSARVGPTRGRSRHAAALRLRVRRGARSGTPATTRDSGGPVLRRRSSHPI